MGHTYPSIPADKIAWIRRQEMFWVATAPLSVAGGGHINLSPKGLRGSLRVQGPERVWYEDLSGSGCETIAHLRENGRITILFCAFEGSPDIVRLYGTGKVYELGSPEYASYVTERLPGSRAVIVVDVHRVGTSCGWGIPFYKFGGHRRLLLDYARGLENKDKKFDVEADGDGDGDGPTVVVENGDGDAHTNGDANAATSSNGDGDANGNGNTDPAAKGGMREWWRTMNAQSIDGLPSVQRAGAFAGRMLGGVIPDAEVAGYKGRRAPGGDAKLEEEANGANGDVAKVKAQGLKGLVGGLDDGNAKMMVGVVVGFVASFVLSDLVVLGRRMILGLSA